MTLHNSRIGSIGRSGGPSAQGRNRPWCYAGSYAGLLDASGVSSNVARVGIPQVTSPQVARVEGHL